MDGCLALGRLWNSPELAEDFQGLTANGGRLVGSASEGKALLWLRERLRGIEGVRLREHRFEYRGWESREASVDLAGAAPRSLRCHPLYWSAETGAHGLEAEVVDLGRGSEEDFARAAARIAGRVVLVDHEYPFAAHSVHRRLKYGWSIRHGAAGFLIANNLPGELLVTGSCGQDAGENIPAFGVSRETGALLRGAGPNRVRLRHRNIRSAREGTNLIAEIPGQGAHWIVVCAHYDGHDLADSALDNATGVAAALALLRAFAPSVGGLARGLRVVLFTAEETGLLGSRRYVEGLSEAERRRIALAINLDTLTGSPRISCLTSGFAELEHFVATVAGETGLSIPCVRPLLRNSDHFNFAQQGIPAMRVIAGFDEPQAGARFLLTQGDTRDKVALTELKLGALVSGQLAWSALNWAGAIAAHKEIPPTPQ